MKYYSTRFSFYLPGSGVWSSTLTLAVAVTLVVTWWSWCASPEPPACAGVVVVSTTTCGFTTISCEERSDCEDLADEGSSVMVVSERLEPPCSRGYSEPPPPPPPDLRELRLPPPLRPLRLEEPLWEWEWAGCGDGGGDGVGRRSGWFRGTTSAGGPTRDSSTGRNSSPSITPSTVSANST